jgi:NADH-quinone oxidoreductase subunit J
MPAVQLLLYAGGIVTIMVFAIVVTERLVGERISQTSRHLAAGAVASLGLAWAITSTVWERPLAIVRPQMAEDLTQIIGETVQTRFVLPFELLALLMLAGLMSAIYFARPED